MGSQVTQMLKAVCCGEQVGLACVHLTSLTAAGCPGLTLNAMQGFPELLHLDLSGCDCIAPATAVSPAAIPVCYMLFHAYIAWRPHFTIHAATFCRSRS